MTAGHGHEDHPGGMNRGDDLTQIVMNESFWDERYRSTGALWSGRPNPNLVTEAAGLIPGGALDVGCGEGADAIWLAEHGWQVTAVDISGVALARAAAHAAAAADIAQRITWLHEDLACWVPATARYDLISVQFMQVPAEPRDSLFRRPQLRWRRAALCSSSATIRQTCRP